MSILNSDLLQLFREVIGVCCENSLKYGVRGGVVVKALRYKPAGRGFDSRRCYWNFSSDIILLVALWP